MWEIQQVSEEIVDFLQQENDEEGHLNNGLYAKQ